MTTTSEHSAIVARIKNVLPLVIQSLTNEDRIPWLKGVNLTVDDLEVARVPGAFVAGESYQIAVSGLQYHVSKKTYSADHLKSRLLVVGIADEEKFMLGDLTYHNEAKGTIGHVLFDFNDKGEPARIDKNVNYTIGDPIDHKGEEYGRALITSFFLNSGDDQEPASGISVTTVDGIKVYEYKEGLDIDANHQEKAVQLPPRMLPRIRAELSKEFKNVATGSSVHLKKASINYFKDIGNQLESTTEQWWISEDMSKIAWDVAMSGTEPEDLSDTPIPATSGIMWLNGSGGPALLSKMLPDEEFFDRGTTDSEILSIDAIIWYLPTVPLKGLEVGKIRFMGLTASPKFAQETSQWGSVLSPIDIESNLPFLYRMPTYVTYHNLKYLPQKMALIIMRLSREESIAEQTDELVSFKDNKGKGKSKNNRRIERITCSNLRRARYASEAERQAEARDYSHRWIVRGHMRNQPVGPRNAEGGQRHERVWIAPYVKGPEGKPLVLKDRVQVWR